MTRINRRRSHRPGADHRRREELVRLAGRAANAASTSCPRTSPAEEAAEIRRQALEELTQAPLDNIAHHSLDVQPRLAPQLRELHRRGPDPDGGRRAAARARQPCRTATSTSRSPPPRPPWWPAPTAAARRSARPAAPSVRVEDVGMTRAPVFRTSGIVQTQQFLHWIREHEDEIRKIDRGHQPPPEAARDPPLRLRHHGLPALPLRLGRRHGHEHGDHRLRPRGQRADRARHRRALRRPVGQLLRGQEAGGHQLPGGPRQAHLRRGPARGAGPPPASSRPTPATWSRCSTGRTCWARSPPARCGFNAHYANVLAAFFIATGQDPAHVVEGSHGRHLHRAARAGLGLRLGLHARRAARRGRRRHRARHPARGPGHARRLARPRAPRRRRHAPGRDPRRGGARRRAVADGGVHLPTTWRGPTRSSGAARSAPAASPT